MGGGAVGIDVEEGERGQRARSGRWVKKGRAARRGAVADCMTSQHGRLVQEGEAAGRAPP
eukprot:201937-Chlamydomonas_euryale.AAC.2